MARFDDGCSAAVFVSKRTKDVNIFQNKRKKFAKQGLSMYIIIIEKTFSHQIHFLLNRSFFP